MNRNIALISVLLAAAGRASAAVVPAVPAGLTNIGIAAAVRGAVRAQAPGETVGRDVASGKPVFLNDHVTTGEGARMQIMLLDETVFTIGPNSDMVLDEFVYDPKTNAGKVSAQITRGVFRFVTGKVAQRNPTDMKVKLPVGTIGIRGTMVEGSVNGQNADILLTGPGADNNAHERPGGITVTNGGGSTDISASGYGTTIREGGAPSPGFRFSPEQVRVIQGALSAPANGGANTGAGGDHASANPGANGSSGEGVGGSASQNSGQTTASGGINFQTTATNLVAANNDTSNFAAQQIQSSAPSDNSTWDSILAIPSGAGEYVGSGSYTGIIGTGSPFTGTFGVDVIVDFGARTLGGGGSYLSVSGGLTDNQQINTVDYNAYAGKFPAGVAAAYVLQSADLGFANSGGSFAGTSLQFKNVSGQAAGALAVTLVYHNTGNSAYATGTSGAIPRGTLIPR
ncbi:MAG: FecR domain-containing protein [Elusimicrobiota bacterium]